MTQLPQLVEILIQEIDRALPGQGRGIYWKAFDRWNQEGRDGDYPPASLSPEFRELNDRELAQHLARVRQEEDRPKAEPLKKTSIMDILGR